MVRNLQTNSNGLLPPRTDLRALWRCHEGEDCTVSECLKVVPKQFKANRSRQVQTRLEGYRTETCTRCSRPIGVHVCLFYSCLQCTFCVCLNKDQVNLVLAAVYFFVVVVYGSFCVFHLLGILVRVVCRTHYFVCTLPTARPSTSYLVPILPVAGTDSGSCHKAPIPGTRYTVWFIPLSGFELQRVSLTLD